MFWKVRAMPRRVTSKGSRPSMRSPLKATEPEVRGMMPVMRLKAVVLPAPLGPMRPWRLPLGRLKVEVLDREEAAEGLGDPGITRRSSFFAASAMSVSRLRAFGADPYGPRALGPPSVALALKKPHSTVPRRPWGLTSMRRSRAIG